MVIAGEEQVAQRRAAEREDVGRAGLGALHPFVGDGADLAHHVLEGFLDRVGDEVGVGGEGGDAETGGLAAVDGVTHADHGRAVAGEVARLQAARVVLVFGLRFGVRRGVEMLAAREEARRSRPERERGETEGR